MSSTCCAFGFLISRIGLINMHTRVFCTWWSVLKIHIILKLDYHCDVDYIGMYNSSTIAFDSGFIYYFHNHILKGSLPLPAYLSLLLSYKDNRLFDLQFVSFWLTLWSWLHVEHVCNLLYVYTVEIYHHVIWVTIAFFIAILHFVLFFLERNLVICIDCDLPSDVKNVKVI